MTDTRESFSSIKMVTSKARRTTTGSKAAQDSKAAQIKLYSFRTLGAMDEESCKEILNLLLNGHIEFGVLEQIVKTSQHLQNVQATLMGEN